MEDKELKAQKVIEYYMHCNSLKNKLRKGWTMWNVQKERIESIAEHIYSVQMLAIAMSNFDDYKDLDIKKVLMMLAIHETEEIIIGDNTLFEMSKEEKEELGHKAIEKVLEPLANKEKIKELILEFDEQKTPEAIYAFYCDKFDCDLQSVIYDNGDYVDLNHQENNIAYKNKIVQRLLNEGKSFSEMWLLFGQEMYNYDENFTAVSNYALEHYAKKLLRKKETDNK